MPEDKKRSLTIAGHRTSLSLEEEFWTALQKICVEEAKSIATIVTEIDAHRGEKNLSSAIRVWILSRLQNQ